jgi:hypothetical protein
MYVKSELPTAQIERFNQLLERLEVLFQTNITVNTQELISREELAKRLKVTVRCIINYEKKNKLKPLRLGTTIRYNWDEVIKTMSKN